MNEQESANCQADDFNNDHVVLDRIAELMSGHEWSPDTLDDIAGLVRVSGRDVDDVDDEDFDA
jgi:hypothetical protein